VRGCGLELDAQGHHRAACSAAMGGERTQHHHEVVHYLAGQLRQAGFPCTDKDGDIPLRHLSYARTTRNFEARGLDGARRDLDEYCRASARTFHHILMNCSLLRSLTGLRQRLPNPLPDPGLWL
jgi:hypothetical protein